MKEQRLIFNFSRLDKCIEGAQSVYENGGVTPVQACAHAGLVSTSTTFMNTKNPQQ
jgi:carbon monoxide dehydrogenase subunit G